MRFLLLLLLPLLLRAQTPDILDRSNLAAWCIVPFDAKKRTPAQRAEMVAGLGLKKVAYDWREPHVAEFEEEILQYQKHGIEFFAFWGVHEKAFALFEKYKLHPQVWLMAPNPDAPSQDEKVKAAAAQLLPVVEQTRKLGCKLALYNHGGWNGEPENMTAIVQHLRAQHAAEHVGIVYNQHHGHAHVADFAAKLKVMQPYLFALNLNGMIRDGEAKGLKIVPLAQGELDAGLLRIIIASGWRGPVGILNHTDEDAEARLRDNLEGLDWLRKELEKPGSAGARPVPRSWKPPVPKAAEFKYEAAPLVPELWPNRSQPVNRERLYDFYLKQAQQFRQQTPAPELLPEFPGLDGAVRGHWGNQTEDTWRDGRLNDMDCGPCVAGVFRSAGWTVAKGVCVRIGEFAACYDPPADEWRALWRGGFLKFSDVRHGLMDGLRPGGEIVDDPLTTPVPRKRVAETYRGYYRHGERTVFAFDQHGTELLRSLRVADGKVQGESGESLREFTKGGPAQWPQVLETTGTLGKPVAGWPYVVDTLTLPFDNPWKALLFIGGHDFLSNGDIALCTMTGDVWRVSGVDAALSKLRWKRMAAGLHQPLGLVVVEDKVCVLGRDQITRLHDLNGDGEADFYECLTNDFETPTGGHDYLCGLERDELGNFYTASGKDGLLRITPGKKTEVLATGFRNPDGLGLAPNGTLTMPYSEGEWTATSAIAQITPSGFYGYRGPQPGKKTLPPLVWLPRGLDNSAGGQTWVPDDRWGPLKGQMIHTSYGAGTHMMILRQKIGDVWQGAAVPLPGDFNAGVHRARFSPHDGQLYLSGMCGWGTYTPHDGCLQRVRFTGGPVQLPLAFEARDNGVLLTFSEMPDATAADAKQHFAQCWNYRYSAAYGSPELSVRYPDTPGHDVLEITSAHVLADGRLFLEIPQLQPAHTVHLAVQVQPGVWRELFMTAHALGVPFTEFPGYQVIAKTAWTGPTSQTGQTRLIPSPFAKGEPGRALRVESAAALQFATKELRARAGERLSLTFANPDALPHNWVLLAPGSVEKVGAVSNALITDPQGFARHYVPDVPEVLAWTEMVNPGGSATIHFTAPAKAGAYPFLCTFPGHWMVMQGVLRVE